MTERVHRVLFLCTGNSARSIIAESVMNRVGAPRFVAYSAGSHPTGLLSPYALELLQVLDYPTDRLRSKSWDEFARPGAPTIDFVITVCDDAAGEVCPVWPGRPVTAHWGLPDPAAAPGSATEKRAGFADTHRLLYDRIVAFTQLPLTKLDPASVRSRLNEIGRLFPANA